MQTDDPQTGRVKEIKQREAEITGKTCRVCPDLIVFHMLYNKLKPLISTQKSLDSKTFANHVWIRLQTPKYIFPNKTFEFRTVQTMLCLCYGTLLW